MGTTVIRLLQALLFLIAFSTALGSESLSYVDGSKPLLAIEDANRQAREWAMCAATYEVLSTSFGFEPSQSQLLKNLSRGAGVAVTMTLVLDDLEPDITTG